MDSGFGTQSQLQSRKVWDAGAIVPGDEAVIVLRFFIPHETAAGKSLFGDGRSFDDAPDLRNSSRAWLVWNTGTGQASLTIAPSTIGPLAGALPYGDYVEGARLSALAIHAKGSADDVQATEDYRVRAANDVFLERTSNNGVRLKAALLNSLTNKVLGAAWSVDFDVRIDPLNDTTRAAFERYAATRSTIPSTTAPKLTRAQSKRSRTTVLCLSGKLKGPRCNSLRASLRRAAKGAVRPDAVARARSVPPQNAAAATTGSGGYAISMVGNGYPAVEAYYYPRRQPGSQVLFRRRVDPDKLNSVTARTIDSGGGVGALDRLSWFDCTSRTNRGSDCVTSRSGKRRYVDILGFGLGFLSFVSPDNYHTNPDQNAQAK
jgi:hypothetical protein